MTRKSIPKRLAALFVALTLCLGLTACGAETEETGFKVLDTVDCGEYAVAFRAGDTQLRDFVNAALSVLAGAGNVHQISLNWFSDDPTSIDGDVDALTALFASLELERAPERELIVGIADNSRPMSYRSADGQCDGFDVDLAEAVCSLLGWRMSVQVIDPADVIVELKSGNIDCAWGGMCFDPAGTDYCLSQGYMPCKFKLVTELGSGIKRKSQLSGKTLAMASSSGALSALKSQSFYEKLTETLECSTTAECFMALSSGKCGAIFVDAYIASFFM